MNFEKYIENAKKSSFGLWKLNFGLYRLIPFNKPHSIKIKTLTDDKIETFLPYKKSNLNHIKGIHACGMATCAEFASGFLLLSKIGFRKYRLIMESIEMKFHYQAKSDVTAEFEITNKWIEEKILSPLKNEDSILFQCEIKLYDKDKKHVATGFTNWQIKLWDKVKTKL